MSTGSNLDQPPEPEQDAGGPGAATNSQRGPKRHSLQSLEDAAGELARAMGLPGPRGQSQREALILAARRAIDAPDLNGINLKAPEWGSRRPELDQLLAAGTALAFIRSEFGRYLTPEAWDQDAAEVKEVLAEAGGRRTRILSSKYRHARSAISQMCLSSLPSDLAGQMALLNAVIDSQEQSRIIEGHMPLGISLFSQGRIAGPQAWPALESIALWRRKIGDEIESGSVPSGLLDYLEADHAHGLLLPLVQAVEELASAQQTHSNAVGAKLEAARRDLLDMGMRNPLLNYRLLRSRGARLQGHSPQEIIDALDEQERVAMLVPESAEESSGSDRRRYLQLNTAHEAADLDRRLLSTYRLANSFIQEQGVNTLFLALGMLQWLDNGANSEPRRAPLVLLPVSLERTNPRGQFQLRHTGDDTVSNVSLREKLRLEFGIALPELPESERLDVASYYDSVAEAVEGLDGWTIDRERVALGFFSFSKLLMYRDLDVATWPEDNSPAEHPIIGALLEDGFDEDPSLIGSDDNLDDVLAPGESYHVVDADGSQTLTLLDVNQGMNLVVQGPPGTGKSQTITNMIAEAVGRGRTVLFVSEKMAALEVVKRRLDNVGLGDAVLELHSHKTAKKMVLDELARTLDLGRPRTGAVAKDVTELTRLRERLNGYCGAVNRTIGDSGVTPFQAAGELLGNSESVLPKATISNISQWSQAEYRRKRGLVEELQARITAMGPPRDHSFWGMGLKELLPAAQDALRAKLSDYRAALEALIHRVNTLARTMRLIAPADLVAVHQTVAAARRALAAPDLTGIDLMSEHWTQRPDGVVDLVESGSVMASLQAEFGSSLRPHAWEQDLSAEKLVLETEGVKPWRLLISEYRSTRKRIAGLTPTGRAPGAKSSLAMVHAIETHQRNESTFVEHEYLGADVFRNGWQGRNSGWPRLRLATQWLSELSSEIAEGQMPQALLDYLGRAPDSGQLLESVRGVDEAVAEFQNAAGEVAIGMDMDVTRRFKNPGTLAEQSLEQQLQFATSCLANLESVHDMVRLNVQGTNCEADGLGPILEAAYLWPSGETALLDVYDRAWNEGLWERALTERPEIGSFDGAAHDQVRQTFQDLDRRILVHNRTRLAEAHWERMPRNQGGGQLAVLRRQFEMRRRHLPIRQLLERAGNPIQAIKPVFMMSPLSIAAYLSPGGVKFDLVVFDEASQVKPVDALGAVMRSGQVVVVGDNQQLPPTPFFETAGQVEEYSDDEVTSDIESILGLFAAQNAPSRMLRWHYRSRHDSLIAVSNHEFYGGGLVLFPSPDAGREETGLFYHHLPDTVYGRGTTGTNPLEAEAVARAVMEHARNRPELSLGVAAFSMAQTRELLDRLDDLRREDQSAEGFFSSHSEEPFFVKNLETVQGDERDVILVSIGYGRAEDGRVDLNFGPLNREGGERRLNVLITRARRRCEVFTNMTEDDIDLERTNSQGVRALRTFLAFAHRGILESRDEEAASGGEAEQPTRFQKSVAEVIKENGYLVAESPGWGTGTVDLAVSAPEKPGRYILGIECDGPSYDSARSARDRDRLRPQVLEGLGWRLHRAWSPEWASNPQRELERVLEAIDAPEAQPPEEFIQEPPAEPVDSASPEEEPSDIDGAIIRDAVPAPEVFQVSEYQEAKLSSKPANRDLAAASAKSLKRWIDRVVQVESPVHISEAVRRICTESGVKRPGKLVQAALDDAGDELVRSGDISRRGDFLWSTDMTRPPVRDRSGLPAASRKLEMVSDEEIAEAICVVVGRSYGIARDQVPARAAKLLGFSRTIQAVKDRFDSVINGLLSEGRLEADGDLLVLGELSDS
ncbi:MAG TPA: DUF3320 domain-containing protein [Dehalococcoidia bacterium]|nr:DUF3320 domain-containing protein [Dehalococcoidia bacterium]HIN22959.1 DUF3320 domain-containing protein [Dehalococcoidia bacterium]